MPARQSRPSKTPRPLGKHPGHGNADQVKPDDCKNVLRQSQPPPSMPPPAANLTDHEHAHLWQKHARAPNRPGVSPPADLYWKILTGEVSLPRPAAQSSDRSASTTPTRSYIPPVRRPDAPHLRTSRAEHTPCFVVKYPDKADNIFCRENGSLSSLCAKYTKTKAMNNNTGYIRTFLMSILGPQVHGQHPSSPENHSATYQPTQVVQVSRCIMKPTPETAQTFYCVVDEEASTKACPSFRVLPKETPISDLPAAVHGKHVKLENLWILACETCPRSYAISVCLK